MLLITKIQYGEKNALIILFISKILSHLFLLGIHKNIQILITTNIVITTKSEFRETYRYKIMHILYIILTATAQQIDRRNTCCICLEDIKATALKILAKN